MPHAVASDGARLCYEETGRGFPVLIVAGDEDEGCLEPGLMLKRTVPQQA